MKTVTSIQEMSQTKRKTRKGKRKTEKDSKISKLRMHHLPKSKEIQKHFLHLQKKNTFGGIGPFLKENGELMDKSEAYEKSFSELKEKAKINNPKQFFKDSPHEFKIENISLDEIEVRNAIDE